MATVHDVVVVGAGLAGLMAARELTRAGLDVRVLEARDRVGGRACTVRLDGHAYDVGGQWIGPSQHRVRALVRELGLQTFPQHHAGRKLLDVRGVRSTYTRSIPSLPPLALIELQLVLWRLDRLAARVPVDRPYEAPFADDLAGRSAGWFVRRHVRSRRVGALFTASVRTVFGADPDEIDLLFLLAYVGAAGGFRDLIEIDGGAQQDRLVDGAAGLASGLAVELGDAVVLGAPVHAVTQDDAGATVHGATTLRARRVVVAVPPALSVRIAHDPPLPPDRLQLAQRMPMGATIKCIATYEAPFWRDDGWSGEVVSDREPFAVVFDDSPPAGPGALVGFIVGEPARRWGAASPESRKRAALEAFTRAFGPRGARPTGYLERDWAAEPWSGGCPVGVMAPGAMAWGGDALRRPHGRVHRAGTETATEWTGYLEGALQSGERVAAEILLLRG